MIKLYTSFALLGPVASCERSSPAVDLRDDLPHSSLMHNAFHPAVSISGQDCSAEVDRPGARQNHAPATHGVPELSPTARCTVLLAPLGPQNPVKHVSSTQTWRGRKQVRSSSADSPAKAAWRHGKELGEHSLLDMDCIALTEAEDGDLGSAVSPDLHTDLPPLAHGPFDKERNGNNQELPQQDVAGRRLLESKSLI